MSLILDALNKADKEKNQTDSSPSLDTEHEIPENLEPESNPKMKVILISVALTAIVVVLALSIVFRKDQQSAGTPTQFSHSPQTSIQTTAPESAQDRRPQANAGKPLNTRKQELQQELQQQRINAQYDSQKQKRAEQQIQAANNVATERQNSPSTQDKERISGLYEQSSETKPDASENTSSKNTREAQSENVQTTSNSSESQKISEAEIEQMRLEALANDPNRELNRIVNEELIAMAKNRSKPAVVATPRVISPQTASPPAANQSDSPVANNDANDVSDSVLAFYVDIGSIRDLPLSAQGEIPTMMYTQHNYSKTRKSIEINEKQYREKSRIGKDLTVDKILEDGVIMRYQEHTFKMSAYNNWINF